MSKKTLTTDRLIHSIKLRASIPETANSFTEEDFLYFINEEIDLGVVPHVLSFHEDYFLYTETIDIVPNLARYSIPERAIGTKLRDVSYLDGSNLYEMTRILVEDKSDPFYNFDDTDRKRFYIEGDEIVIQPALASSSSSKLQVSYYMRPNTIVAETEVAKITKVNRNNGLVTVESFPDTFQDLSTFDIVSAKSSFRLLAKDLAPDGIATGTNLNFTFGSIRQTQYTFPVIGDITDSDYFLLDDNANGTHDLYAFWFDLSGSAIAPVVTGASLIRLNCSMCVTNTDVINVAVANINATFTNGTVVSSLVSTDILNIQNGGNGFSVGNNYTVEFIDFDAPETVISIGETTIPDKVSKNDIIGNVEETSIPQIPIELHAMLAQRCAMRCLESMGDVTGLQAAAAKLADMETKTGTLIDNRVESSPLKIVPRHSTIRRRTYNTRR